eukprot:1156136-Pelagomonas_calceolata.AAC.4
MPPQVLMFQSPLSLTFTPPCSNYQSKDIAHVQKSIAQKMADKARSAKDPRCRVYARMALEGLPRGGGNG